MLSTSHIAGAILAAVVAISVESCQRSGQPQGSGSSNVDTSWHPIKVHRDSVGVESIEAQLTTGKLSRTIVPSSIIAILDSTHPGWILVSHRALDAPSVKDQQSERYEFYPCDLNGDSVRDYACSIIAGADSSRAEWFLAFVSQNPGIRLFTLGEYKSSRQALGMAELGLLSKGAHVPNFSEAGPDFDIIKNIDSITVILKNDGLTLTPISGCCQTTFVFGNGEFHGFTSSD
jgi:hypothetical protein